MVEDVRERLVRLEVQLEEVREQLRARTKKEWIIWAALIGVAFQRVAEMFPGAFR